MPTEASIREQLARRLSLLEEGLTLIKTEFRLPNPLGSTGSIDILARDRFGHRVIIEVKKSNQTARQALHELVKYVALFVVKEGLSPSRLRCIVVSTEWHELLVPFAEFVSSTNFQAEGFQLYLKDDAIDRADRIALPQLPGRATLFQQHGIFLFRMPSDRDDAIEQVERVYIESGAESFLLVVVDYRGQHEQVIYPHGIYAVPVKLSDEAKSRITQAVQKEEPEFDESELAALFEDTFLEEIVLKTLHFNEKEYSYEIGYPEKFTSLLELNWEPTRIIRHGHFGEAAADESELLRLIAGTDGQSEIRFQRISSPQFELAWSEMLDGSCRSLEGNRPWQLGFDWFCEFVKTEYEKATVSVAVFNPLRFPISLYKLISDDDPRFLPQMELVAFSEDRKIAEVVHGVLLWDGKTMPTSFNSMMQEVCGGAEEYFFKLHLGIAWELDIELMKHHGLRYGLVRCQLNAEGMRFEEMEVDEDGARFFGKAGCGLLPFPKFFEANEKYLLDLVAAIDKVQFGL